MEYIRKILLFAILTCLFSGSCLAEEFVLLLHNGRSIVGDIELQNSEVIILRTAGGQRYQYPMSEVDSIYADIKQSNEPQSPNEVSNTTPGKVALRLQVGCGVAVMPHEALGTDVAVNWQIGSRNAFDKGIFLGGSIGYHGCFMSHSLRSAESNVFLSQYHYVPIMFVASFPVLQGKHAPEIEVGAGYGISCHQTQGGVCAQVNINYRYAFSAKGVLLVGIYSHLQQDRVPIYEQVDTQTYKNIIGENLVSTGIRLAIQF